jgi:excisionase family DNA binding protein
LQVLQVLRKPIAPAASEGQPVSTATLTAEDTTLLLLTVEEAARRLSIGRTLTYALIASGELASVPVGRLRRVPTEALSEYITHLRQASTPTVKAN